MRREKPNRGFSVFYSLARIRILIREGHELEGNGITIREFFGPLQVVARPAWPHVQYYTAKRVVNHAKLPL